MVNINNNNTSDISYRDNLWKEISEISLDNE